MNGQTPPTRRRRPSHHQQQQAPSPQQEHNPMTTPPHGPSPSSSLQLQHQRRVRRCRKFFSSLIWNKAGPRRRIGTIMAVTCSLYLCAVLLMGRRVFHNDAAMRQASLANRSLKQQQPKHAVVVRPPPLSMNDFQIDAYLNGGSVNDACLVRFREAHVAHAHGVADANQTFVLKLNYKKFHQHKEITSFERFAHIDDQTAERLHFLRPIWMQRNATNPYYCTHAQEAWREDIDDDAFYKNVNYDDYEDCVVEQKSPELPESFDGEARVRFRMNCHADVIVLPLLEHVEITETVETFRDVKVFFRSYLQVLEVAHAHQVNNGDLQVLRNLFINKTTGQAILFDWNGLLEIGDNPFVGDESSRYSPPEVYLEKYFDIKAEVTHFHAMDIWQVGIGLAHLMYYPCQWQSSRRIKKDKSWLGRLILTLGGKTRIALSNDNEAYMDLALLAGMQPPKNETFPIVPNKQFQPMLDDGHRKPCTKPSWYMDNPNVTQAEKELSIDFLRRMLVLSPAERPTATELLQHAFFDELVDDETTVAAKQ